ncbi:MAG: cytochrome bd-I oxidase subunit CydX [Methylobacter sp.]
MWYFTWILGLLLACSLGIINVLRLEAQETWDREHIPLDALTQLMTKDTMLNRLREKVENSKRNGFPFSVLFISLTDFKAQHKDLPDFEMDAILRGVVDSFKSDIRAGVDIAARMGEQDFLIALPGSPLKKAERLAGQIKSGIAQHVQAPGLTVVASVGFAEYASSPVDAGFAATASEVDGLIKAAIAKSA